MYPQSSKRPSFATAEYYGVVPPDYCRSCGSLITDCYFRSKGDMLCSVCAKKAGYSPSENAEANGLRAIVYGFTASAAGILLGNLVIPFAHWSVAALAPLVGYGIGESMRRGARGILHSRYSVLAAVLAYVSITLGSNSALVARAVDNFATPGSPIRIPAMIVARLFAPFMEFAEADDGIFALLIVAAGVAFAVKEI